MQDKFGKLQNSAIADYYTLLVGRVYKLLPMKENQLDKDNWKKERDKLVNELHSGETLFNNCGLYIEIIYKLESLDNLEHIPFDKNSPFKKCIVETIDVVKQLSKKYEEEYGANDSD